MATIGAIHSKLTLNTRDFRTGMQRAGKTARSAAGAIGRTIKRVGTFGAAAGAAAVGGVALLTRQNLESIDATAKMARQLGFTTEQLIGLRHAADLSGVAHEDLEKSIQRMARRLGEAANGEGQASAALKRLGIDARQFAEQSTDAQFKRIAEEVSKIENPTKKAALAYEFFGRQGVDLLNVLNQGREGLTANQREAERLGETFSAIDARKIEMANDAMTRVQAGIQGASNQLTIELAPFIDAAANKLLSMGDKGQNMGKMVTNAFEWVASGIASVADWLKLGEAYFKTMQAVWTKGLALLTRSIGQWGQGIQTVVNLIPGVETHFGDFVNNLADNLDEAAARAWKSAKQAGNNFAEGSNSQAVKETFREIRDQADKTARALENANNQQVGPQVNESKVITVGKTLAELRKQAEASKDIQLPINLKDLQSRIDALTGTEHIAKIRTLVKADAGRSKLTEALDLIEKIEAKNPKVEVSVHTKVEGKIDDLQKKLHRMGMSDNQVQLADLGDLGATNEQLRRAKRTLEQIDSFKNAKDRQNSIQSTLDDLEKRARTFGMSKREKTLIDLESLGATEKQIEKAKKAFDELERKKNRQNKDERSQSQSLIRAGSAQAQRIAFQANRGASGRRDDDTPKRQLRTQERMATVLDEIRQNQEDREDEGGWTL